MKKIILSLSALFAVSMASAQSYISQPDPTTYEVRKYNAEKKTETPQAAPAPKETEASTQATGALSQAQDAAPAPAAQPATAPEKNIAENKKKK